MLTTIYKSFGTYRKTKGRNEIQSAHLEGVVGK